MGRADRVVRVLRFLLRAPSEVSALEVGEGTGLRFLLSGDLYPILARLETRGWLTSRWTLSDILADGSPRRRVYALTAAGVRDARVVVDLLGGDYR
jgi:PadR family transcriptional regulator PadR